MMEKLIIFYVHSFLDSVGSPNLFDLSSYSESEKKIIFLSYFSGSTDTQSNSTYQSKSSTNSSPTQSIPYSPNLSIDDFGLNFTEQETIDFSSVTEPTDKLQIISQPKAFYRERYCSETDPNKHRAQRFIRSDDDSGKFEYPTVQV